MRLAGQLVPLVALALGLVGLAGAVVMLPTIPRKGRRFHYGLLLLALALVVGSGAPS